MFRTNKPNASVTSATETSANPISQGTERLSRNFSGRAAHGSSSKFRRTAGASLAMPKGRGVVLDAMEVYRGNGWLFCVFVFVINLRREQVAQVGARTWAQIGR